MQIILASSSKRRQQLLKNAQIEFSIIQPEFDEMYPKKLRETKIPRHIVKKKIKVLKHLSNTDNIIVVADTIVWTGKECLEKPKNEEHAREMLKSLSNKKHQVITVVGFLHDKEIELIEQKTVVKFRKLRSKEISFYVKNFKPIDKAGAYGIQEWIGPIGIDWINGSYTNVMGLPLSQVLEKLRQYNINNHFD